jgi:CBS domain-containing protein
MKLADVMVKEVIQASPEDSVAQAAKRMREGAVGCLIVTVGGAVKGIITDRDLLACLAHEHDPYRCAISRHMNRPVVVVGPDEDHTTAVSILCRKRIKRLPIAKDGKLLGIVSLSDLAMLADEEVKKIGSSLSYFSAMVKAQSSQWHAPLAPARSASVEAVPSVSTESNKNNESLEAGGPG